MLFNSSLYLKNRVQYRHMGGKKVTFFYHIPWGISLSYSSELITLLCTLILRSFYIIRILVVLLFDFLLFVRFCVLYWGRLVFCFVWQWWTWNLPNSRSFGGFFSPPVSFLFFGSLPSLQHLSDLKTWETPWILLGLSISLSPFPHFSTILLTVPTLTFPNSYLCLLSSGRLLGSVCFACYCTEACKLYPGSKLGKL